MSEIKGEILVSEARELADAAKNLLDWVPVCSVGSSGHQRIERLKEAIKKFDAAPEVGEKAIEFCLQCLRAGCTADEVMAAWRKIVAGWYKI
jgi:hypothetical protein